MPLCISSECRTLAILAFGNLFVAYSTALPILVRAISSLYINDIFIMRLYISSLASFGSNTSMPVPYDSNLLYSSGVGTAVNSKSAYLSVASTSRCDVCSGCERIDSTLARLTRIRIVTLSSENCFIIVELYRLNIMHFSTSIHTAADDDFTKCPIYIIRISPFQQGRN